MATALKRRPARRGPRLARNIQAMPAHMYWRCEGCGKVSGAMPSGGSISHDCRGCRREMVLVVGLSVYERRQRRCCGQSEVVNGSAICAIHEDAR